MVRQQGFTKRAPRVDIRRPAVMIDSDGRESDVVILDISSGGFRLQIPESPRIGEFVTLRVERGEEFPTQIRWALGDEAGGVFLTSAGYERWEDRRGKAVAGDRTGTGDRRKGEARGKGDRREGQGLDGDRVQRGRRGRS